MSDDVSADKSRVLREFRSLQNDVGMTDMLRTISETSSDMAGLPGRIQTLRDKGYAFAGYLEGKAETLKSQWEAVEFDAKEAVRRQQRELSSDLDDLAGKADKLEGAEGLAAQTYINQLEPGIERLEREVRAAETRIESTFGKVPENVKQTIKQIENIEKYIELAGEATFQLAATEAIFMAVDAEWQEGDKPDGIFYITDQRIVFEQKEKTGKNFLGMGGKMTQEVEFEVPVNLIEEVAHENKGLMGGVDLIHLTFRAGAPIARTTVEVKKGIKAEWFAGQLKRASTGGLSKERALEIDDELVEAIANAPTTCPVCGATFEEPIIAGMTQIKCTYCGAVTRLSIPG
jgi:hypothetical protein